MRVVLLMLVAIGVAAPVFLAARERARLSAGARLRAIITGAIGVGVGLTLSLWLPTRITPTEGSPASLVALVLLWVVGGGFAYLSLAMLLGAATVRTRPASADPSSNRD